MKTKLLVTEWFGEFPVLIVDVWLGTFRTYTNIDDVELLAKIVDGLKPLVIFAKKLHPRRSFHDNQIVYGWQNMYLHLYLSNCFSTFANYKKDAMTKW